MCAHTRLALLWDPSRPPRRSTTGSSWNVYTDTREVRRIYHPSRPSVSSQQRPGRAFSSGPREVGNESRWAAAGPPAEQEEQAGPSKKQQGSYGSLVESRSRSLRVPLLRRSLRVLAVSPSLRRRRLCLFRRKGQICQSKEEKKTKRKWKHSQLSGAAASLAPKQLVFSLLRCRLGITNIQTGRRGRGRGRQLDSSSLPVPFAT